MKVGIDVGPKRSPPDRRAKCRAIFYVWPERLLGGLLKLDQVHVAVQITDFHMRPGTAIGCADHGHLLALRNARVMIVWSTTCAPVRPQGHPGTQAIQASIAVAARIATK